MQGQEDIRIIMDAIERIPNENWKSVLKLRLQGYRLSEIAEYLGWSDDSVKGAYKRGRWCLKEELQNMGYKVHEEQEESLLREERATR